MVIVTDRLKVCRLCLSGVGALHQVALYDSAFGFEAAYVLLNDQTASVLKASPWVTPGTANLHIRQLTLQESRDL